MEEQARRSFEAGRATFMRNWPYAYAAGKANKNAPKFEVAPFPEFEGGGKAGILGGHNLVISALLEEPGWRAGADRLPHEPGGDRTRCDRVLARAGAPDDLRRPERAEGAPVRGQLKQAIAQAKSRPVSPVYTQISQAIYKNVNQALSGQVSPEEALKTGQSEMEKALATF